MTIRVFAVITAGPGGVSDLAASTSCRSSAVIVRLPAFWLASVTGHSIAANPLAWLTTLMVACSVFRAFELV